MTPIDDNLPTLDDQWLDRLVDGQLSETQRRELLAQLDTVPDAWRRCALAFLEAQCWRETFRAVPQEPAAQTLVPASPVARPRRWLGTVGTLLAMAASFLLALGLGSWIRWGWPASGSPAEPATPLATTSDGGPEIPDAAEPATPSPREAQAEPWQTVALPASDADGSVSLPAAERDRLDEGWLDGLPSSIPPEMLQALQQSGHRVDVQRRLVPYPMNDGRQLVVPVDQLDVHYVGNRAYQ